MYQLKIMKLEPLRGGLVERSSYLYAQDLDYGMICKGFEPCFCATHGTTDPSSVPGNKQQGNNTRETIQGNNTRETIQGNNTRETTQGKQHTEHNTRGTTKRK